MTTYTSISDFLEAHGYKPEGDMFLKWEDRNIKVCIVYEDWKGLSLEAFIEKAHVNQWVPLNTEINLTQTVIKRNLKPAFEPFLEESQESPRFEDRWQNYIRPRLELLSSGEEIEPKTTGYVSTPARVLLADGRTALIADGKIQQVYETNEYDHNVR